MCCLLSPINIQAQSGTWIWMNGSNAPNNTGTYGVQGTPSVSNSPPAMYQAQQWTDKQGNFWVFGGVDSNQNEYSDLWEYIPTANTWTWVNGPGIPLQGGSYGTLGVPSFANIPGARAWGCATWTDTVGDLWLFGGEGYDSLGHFGNLNDLWSYNIARDLWTWRGGPPISNQPPVYGSLYQASDSSVPPSRSESNTAWIDGNDNLWLFGGYGYNIVSGCYNDIWRYNIASGQWAWMGGSKTLNAPGNYGALGVESASNEPSGRCSYVHWVDSSYLYFACGATIITSNLDYPYNDLWRFNMNTNYFTWIGGDSTIDPAGQYTHYCSTAYGDKPQGLIESRAVESSANGCTPVLFMWGGGADSGYVNDLWGFDLKSRQWRWISGYDSVNALGSFGVQGVSSATNMPPGGMGPCFWTDNSGNLWLWGGQCALGSSSNYLNNLNTMWEYIPDPTCFPVDSSQRVSITPASITICPGDSAQLCAPAGFNSYAWSSNDTTECFYTTLAGPYSVTVSSNVNCRASSNTVNINVYNPTPVTVSASGDTLTGYGSSNYQWLLNGLAIPGANSSVYIANTSGTYSLQIVDTNGCVNNSSPIVVAGITNEIPANSITVYPNPSTGNWQLNITGGLAGIFAEIFDATGRLVYNAEIRNPKTLISIPGAASGVYELRITGQGYSVVKKLVKL